MSKANRKAKPKKRQVEVKEELPLIAPINTNEVQYLNGIVQVSNLYAKLRQQYSQYELALQAVIKNRDKIRTGDYDSINVPIAPDTTTTITDKAEMLKYVNNQIAQLKNALGGIRGQMENKRDIFVEHGLRLEAFATRRFGGLRVKHIASDRKGKIEDEQVLFEAEFDKETQKLTPASEVKFKKALKKAKVENSKKA